MSVQPSPTLFAGIKFLVVDDEPDNLEVAATLIRFLGGNVEEAENGVKALDLARTFQPNVIIADLSMPVMSGWEMLEALRKIPAIADIPVIALTAHAMIGDRERVLEAGFNNYLSKPIHVEYFIPELLEALKEIPTIAKLLG
jgi:CheY-like chemotaxis protein